MEFNCLRKKMKVTSTIAKQNLPQSGGRMSSWHCGGSPLGNVGGKV